MSNEHVNPLIAGILDQAGRRPEAPEQPLTDAARQLDASRDAALRAESVRLENEKRAVEREKQELLATDGLIGAVRTRIGSEPRYAGIAAAIDEYMSPGRPIPAQDGKRAKRGMPA